MINSALLKKAIQEHAQHIGFDAFGVAPIALELRRDYYLKWIQDGKNADMQWMQRNNDKRLNPSLVLDGAKSILCFGMNYYQDDTHKEGRIAKYALGEDYHSLILDKLKSICLFLEKNNGLQKAYVDTGPVLEKPIAQQAGLGWQGKSTILIHPKKGTWLFLGFIFTTLEIEPDKPYNDHCGKCTRCIDVCPTKAIIKPYELDARRCIAYLTIEHKGSIPIELRDAIGDHLYGCDDCLDVCPWNRWATKTKEESFSSKSLPPLKDVLFWTESTFKTFFQKSPIKRLKLERFIRNICVVLGNIGNMEDREALIQMQKTNTSPLIEEHAQWAIQKIKKRYLLLD